MKTSTRKLLSLILAVALVVGIPVFHLDMDVLADSGTTNLFGADGLLTTKTAWTTGGVVDQTAGHDGGACIKLTQSQYIQYKNALLSQMTVGQPYELSFWYKTDNIPTAVNHLFKLSFMQTSSSIGGVIAKDSELPPTDGAWQKMTLYVTNNIETTENGYFRLQAPGASGTYYVDDISLVPTNAVTSTNLVMNGDFEFGADYFSYWLGGSTAVQASQEAGRGWVMTHTGSYLKYNRALLGLMQAGVTYELSFDYKLNKDTKFALKHGSSCVALSDTTLEATDAWRHVSYDVAIANAMTTNSTSGNLTFQLAAGTTMSLDNLVLKKKVAEVIPPAPTVGEVSGATLYIADENNTAYPDGTLAIKTDVPAVAVPDGCSVVEYGTIAHPYQLLNGTDLTLGTENLGSPARAKGEGLTVGSYYAVFPNSTSISGGVKIAVRSYIKYKDAENVEQTIYSEETYVKSTNQIKRAMAKDLINNYSNVTYDSADISGGTVDIAAADIAKVWAFVKRNRAYFDSL